MIDLHLHILPGVDDGAADAAVAGVMLQEAKHLGFTTLVATPHMLDHATRDYLDHVEMAYATIEPMAERLGLELLTGFEVMLTPDLPIRLRRGEPLTLAGSRAVLIELPVSVWPTYTETTLFALQTAGFTPILAHPERYETLRRDPERAVRLAERGIVLQVTLASVSGLFGKSMQRLVDRWLLAGAVQVVATDAHSRGRRLMDTTMALRRLEQMLGAAEVRRLTVDAPTALLRDQPVPRPLLRGTRPPTGLRAAISDWFRR